MSSSQKYYFKEGFYDCRWHCFYWVNSVLDFLKIFRKKIFSFLSFALLILSGCKEESQHKAPSYPYFASLKASKINARCGPGMSYPIEWIFIKPDLPVEVLEEHENWRKVRDIQGDEAWVNKTMLKRKRMGVVSLKVLPLHNSPDLKSPLLAYLSQGVLVEIKSCDGTWCSIKTQNFKGFIQEKGLFGVLKNEAF